MSPVPKPFRVNSETMDMAQRMLEGEDLDKFSLNELNRAVKAIKNIQQDSIKHGEYKIAQRCEDVYRQIQAKLKKEHFIMTREMKDDDLIDRLNTATDEFNETNQKAENILTTFEKRRADALEALDAKHKQELEQFDQNHTYDKMLPKFAKYSQNYLNLKFRERSLVSSKRFIEAEALNKLAKKIQEEEDQQHRENWDNFVSIERNKLLQKQANQMSALNDKFEKDKSALMPSVIKTREIQTRSIQAIQKRREIAPPPTRISLLSRSTTITRMNTFYKTI